MLLTLVRQNRAAGFTPICRVFGVCVLISGILTYPGYGQETASAVAEKQGESQFFTNVRPLTSSGLRSGEGYYSADGTKMVFQSERSPDNPFYQMYLLDFEEGDISRISPGHGKTTCGWIHPDGTRVMYASTQDDAASKEKQQAKLRERAEGTESRYNWDYDPEYDIYAYDLKSGEYTRITHERGYDAEGSYSPDGTKIAIASNRRAYIDGELSEAEQELFDFHQASVMDIYIMDADGSNPIRLTEEIGYDGGPFFSPDGQRICWRRFKPDMSSAEIWTMNIDGSDKRKLTDLNATSFAPYYHPSNDYLVFISNPEGYSNFEVYMIPVDGGREPVRVTFTEGFDGFPVFSPDGKTFSWTSNRVGNVSQIYAADWNHEAALKALGLAADNVAGASDNDDVEFEDVQVDTGSDEETGRAAIPLTSPRFTPEDVLRHVDYLCKPELAGRLTGSEGERRATAYVAAYLDLLGFQPAGDVDSRTGKPTWFQNFEYPAGARLGEDNELQINDRGLKPGADWMPLNFSASGTFSGKVAFAGYGIVAPQTENSDAYDAFVHLDVTDKWVMVFRFLPEDVTPQRRQELNFYSQLRVKAANVRDRGGKGLIVVSGPNSQVKNEVIEFGGSSASGRVSIPVISISDEVAQSIMELAEQDLQWWQSQLDNGEPQIGFDFPNLELTASVDVIQKRGRGRNVVGRLQMGERPSDSAIIVGAHIDHLGRGDVSSMARDEVERRKVHVGADDNASGVAGLLEIAQYISAQKRDGDIDARRDLVVAAWSGEELGLFGSSHFVKSVQAEIKAGDPDAPQVNGEPSINSRFAAYLNMDMIGRFDEKLVLQGLGSSDWWGPVIEKRNLATGIIVQPNQDTNLPTDASEFYRAGVPILAAFTGTHNDYHTPRDTPEKLDYPMTARIARLMGLITKTLLTESDMPEYQVHEEETPSMRFAGRASLGTSPDYTAEVVGTMIKSVRSGSAAEKAGIQGRDIVVELAGTKVENVYDYTNAIGALKVGEEVTIVVLRDGERMELSITPESRN